MKTKCSLISILAIILIALNVQAQYANTSLNNLTNTAVNRSLVPRTTNAIDLGSSTKLWRNVYFSGDALINGLTVGIGAGAQSLNTAVGNGALHSNTSGGSNTATGYQALYSNATGGNNTANGYQALYSNIDGSSNTANGYLSLYYNKGSNNTATGIRALYFNDIESGNTADGSYALTNNTGNYNNATGYQALYSNTTGSGNTANGFNALFSNTTGTNNTATSLDALISNTSGYNNTAEGFDADVNAGNYTNVSAFGNSALITASNQVRIGNNSVTSIGGYVNWSNISDGRVKKNIKQNVPGLDFINKLQPVTYNLDLDAADKIVQRPVIKDKDGNVVKPSQEEISSRQAKEQIVYTGFIAQDVEKAAQEIGYNFSGVDAPKNDKDLYALRYSDFIVPLVKAVQELSQQNDDLKKEVEDLKAGMSSSDTKFQTSNSEFQNAYLNQNSPNPFSQNTIISYFLPESVTNAVINMYSVQGDELRSFALSSNGHGQISINGNTMQPGVYVYVLIADGRTVDTKQMILTK